MESTIIKADKFDAYYGDFHAIKGISIDIPKNGVVAMMGPSGCGKTTFIRCINRLHELTPGAKTGGKLLFNDPFLN